MIAIGTDLIPRSAADPVVRVVGVAEPDRYVVQPGDFGSCFSLDFDAISAAYDCSDHTVAIEAYDEQREWSRLSAERFHGKLARRREKQQAALPTPEQAIAASEAANANGRR